MTLSQNKKYGRWPQHAEGHVSYIHLYPDVSLAHVHPTLLWKTDSDDGERSDPLKWWLKTF